MLQFSVGIQPADIRTWPSVCLVLRLHSDKHSQYPILSYLEFLTNNTVQAFFEN